MDRTPLKALNRSLSPVLSSHTGMETLAHESEDLKRTRARVCVCVYFGVTVVFRQPEAGYWKPIFGTQSARF